MSSTCYFSLNFHPENSEMNRKGVLFTDGRYPKLLGHLTSSRLGIIAYKPLKYNKMASGLSRAYLTVTGRAVRFLSDRALLALLSDARQIIRSGPTSRVFFGVQPK